METDLAETYVRAGVVTSPLPPPLPIAGSPGIRSTENIYTNATIDGTASRTSRILYVMPLENQEVNVEVGCASAIASADAQLTAFAIVNRSRVDQVSDASDALEVRACTASDLKLIGSFVVVLWEWDCYLTANEGESNLWSGETQPENMPADSRPVVSRAQQVFVTVTDGVFTIRGNDDSPPLLYVNSLQLDSVQSIVMTQASGHVQDAEMPVGSNVELSGQMSLALQRGSSGVAVQVQDGMETLEVDGQSVTLASTAPVPRQDGFELLWVFALGAVGLVAVPTALMLRPKVRAVRHRRVDQSILRSQELFLSLRFEDARTWGAKAVDLAPENPHSHYRLAQALGRLGQPEAALHHHTMVDRFLRASGQDPELAAENALQAAESAAANGDKPVATRWLQQALQQKPALKDIAEASPELRPVLGQLEQRGLVGDQAPYWLRP